MTSARLPTKRLGVLLFPGFELLDVFGPLEMFANLEDLIKVHMVAGSAGPVASHQGPEVLADVGLADCPPLELILVPGGFGTYTAVDDQVLIDWLADMAGKAETVMTVCTGTMLLARTGLLDGRRATTNKAWFGLVASTRPEVEWVKVARWIEDGKFVTSSGVSAGIDMALAVISRVAGGEVAEALALATEYEWHRDPAWDPFAARHGLSGD
ncbi:MAG: DJ-1/PfpI family protein [Deltaproteobacteria bacterium]